MSTQYMVIEVIEREISDPTYHKNLEAAQAKMQELARQALDVDENATVEELMETIQNYDGDMDETSGYCTRHGQNYDWKIFKI